MSRTAADKAFAAHVKNIDKILADLHKMGFPGAVFGCITAQGSTVVLYHGNLTGIGQQLREAISESKTKKKK